MGMSTVNEADAKKAYGALMDFKDAVKANPITATAPETPAALSGKLGAIDGAAAQLSAASYPFIQSVDWSSDLYSRPLPGASPLAVTKAMDKALVMGAAIDSKLLKEAAEAHHKALNGMDSKLVATQADSTAVNAALGKVFASVPTSQVMDTYNACAKLVDGSVPAKLFSGVNPSEAVRSYDALVEFCKRGEGCSTLAQTRDDCSHALSDVLALRFLKQLTTSASASHDLPCLLLRDLLSTSSSTAE